MGSGSHCTGIKVVGAFHGPLFGVPALAGPGRLKAGHRTDSTTQTGSLSQCVRKNERGLSMNRAVVGQASRLPQGRLAPGFVAGETPGKTAGTAAPLLPPSLFMVPMDAHKRKGGSP